MITIRLPKIRFIYIDFSSNSNRDERHFEYCMSKKSCLFLCSKLLIEIYKTFWTSRTLNLVGKYSMNSINLVTPWLMISPVCWMFSGRNSISFNFSCDSRFIYGGNIPEAAREYQTIHIIRIRAGQCLSSLPYADTV